MSERERPTFRNPFNPAHFTGELYATRRPVERIGKFDFKANVSPDVVKRPEFVISREERRRAVEQDSRAYQWALEFVGGRVPVLGAAPHQVETGLRLDNAAVAADTLQTAARLATFLYDRISIPLDIDSYMLKMTKIDKEVKKHGDHEKITKGRSTLDEDVRALNHIRKIIPRILDRNTSRRNHPSSRIKPEGVIGLSMLATVSPDAIGALEIREAAKEVLETKNPYALRLYYDNLDLFGNHDETTYLTGEVDEEDPGMNVAQVAELIEEEELLKEGSNPEMVEKDLKKMKGVFEILSGKR